MLIGHRGERPTVPDSAYVAPNAVVCGDVRLGEDARVLFGAVVTAEGGPVDIGESTIVMEQAVVRGRERHSTSISDHVIVGPHAHVNGATVEDAAFLATGSSVFMGARVGAGAEVRINGVGQVNTHLPAEGLVPIGWVAVGDPAEVLPPGDHERIWSIQRELDFPGTAFGLPRAPARELLPAATARYAETFGRHRENRVLGGDPGFERFSSETRWERAVGYSRAVRAGSLVFVAGTVRTESWSARETPTPRPAMRSPTSKPPCARPVPCSPTSCKPGSTFGTLLAGRRSVAPTPRSSVRSGR